MGTKKNRHLQTIDNTCPKYEQLTSSDNVKLTELIDQTFKERAHFIWLVMIKMPFLLLNNLNDVNCGHVRKCVMRSIIFWTIY